MKKYYATECNPESYDYRCYYDEYMAEEDNIWAGGNSRNFSETNPGLRKDVVTSLEDAYYDIFEVEAEDEEIIDTVKYYFKKKNKQELSESEIAELLNLIRTFSTCASRDENDIICQVLTILYDEPFENGTIKGCCQGDWLEIIYPESRKNLIPWIEAVWFATGTEFRITEEPIESVDELDDVMEVCAYTNLWRDEDIKNWLCKEIDCKPEELVVRKISGTHHYTTFDYEEI